MEIASLVINGLMLLAAVIGLAKPTPLPELLQGEPVEQVAPAPEPAPDPFIPIDADW